MHIKSLKDQQKSSFYIAQFKNIVMERFGRTQTENYSFKNGDFVIDTADETRHEMMGLNVILFYKTGHLAINVK